MGFSRTSWEVVMERGVVKTALIVAAVAGTLLNLINQGPQLMRGQPLDVARLLLTYVVPYVVSTIGAVSTWRRRPEQNSSARTTAAAELAVPRDD